VSIDVRQLRTYVLLPTLRFLAESNLLPYTLAADNLVLGTALTESAGKYIRQIGGGPALGLTQMEPATHDDIWRNWLLHPARKPLADRVRQLETAAYITDGPHEMIGNLYYAFAMCRIHYRRLPAALPPEGDARALATYWKRYYNTSLGAGTIEKALPYFETAVRDRVIMPISEGFHHAAS
jgi:hypothetical protein